MRVIFVGVHNKVGMTPLDSKSVSGKRVDAIIARVGIKEYVKTNLFDDLKIPVSPTDVKSLIAFWELKYRPSENDIVVLLGGIVQHLFPKGIECKRIRVAHPSLQYSKVKPDEYISSVAEKINAYLKTTTP
jgi:hypothetical protein